MLVPVLLHMPPLVAYSLLETLYAGGHIYADRPAASVESVLCCESLADNHEPAVMSFISRLWKRLSFDGIRA
jgi:hypothetical protein